MDGMGSPWTRPRWDHITDLPKMGKCSQTCVDLVMARLLLANRKIGFSIGFWGGVCRVIFDSNVKKGRHKLRTYTLLWNSLVHKTVYFPLSRHVFNLIMFMVIDMFHCYHLSLTIWMFIIGNQFRCRFPMIISRCCNRPERRVCTVYRLFHCSRVPGSVWCPHSRQDKRSKTAVTDLIDTEIANPKLV